MSQFRILPDAKRAALQLREEVISACAAGLDEGDRKRSAIQTKENFMAWREEAMKFFKDSFPPELFERAPISAKRVSYFEFDDFSVENVLFCSLPGWEVNASVYRPLKSGKYPGVVCPTGHSSKFGPNYIQSCETIAKNGYIAVSFCPPGCSGELAAHNDHFTNGIMGWLTGMWCQTHFLADALACIDYLETRGDVDMSKGVAMTGVSGGGLTTMFCAALDPRITFFAPVCCLGDHRGLSLKDLYSSCPEQFGLGFIGKGLNFIDILLLSCPKPSLLVGGELDEIFDYHLTESFFTELKRIYGILGCPEDTELYIEKGTGHAYSVTMASEVVKRLNRRFKNGEAAKSLTSADITYMEEEKLACHPSGKVNMFTINAQRSRMYAETRKKHTPDELKQLLKKLLVLDSIPSIEKVEEDTSATPSWQHQIYPTILTFDSVKQLPGIFVRRLDNQKRGCILWLDGKDKWNAIEGGGFFPGNPIGLLNRYPKEDEVSLFSVEVSGLGELEMQRSYYDMCSWNRIERIISYLSFSQGRPLMSYRVRDALIAVEYLKSRDDVDEKGIILGGSGLGALTALLTAILSDDIHRVILHKLPPSYSEIVENEGLPWTESMMIPHILQYTDLPELLEAVETTII